MGILQQSCILIPRRPGTRQGAESRLLASWPLHHWVKNAPAPTREAGGIAPRLPSRHRTQSVAQAAATSMVTMNRARPRPRQRPEASLGH
jgi:hypothetical protein